MNKPFQEKNCIKQTRISQIIIWMNGNPVPKIGQRPSSSVRVSMQVDLEIRFYPYQRLR